MKYLTLMIIPYPGANVRSLRVSHRILKVLAVVLAVILSAAIAFGIYLRPVFQRARQYDSLIAENRELTSQNRKIGELQTKIGSIDEIIRKIQLAQGVKTFDQAAKEEGVILSGTQVAEGVTQSESAAGAESQQKPQILSTVSPVEAGAGSNVPFGRPIDEKSFISRTFNPKIFHYGIDFALKQGTPVRATADGVVVIAEKNDNLGYYVKIKHDNGFSTMYAHNSRLTVQKGDRVKKGDLIAYSGNMGVSSGPHLHYAVFDENGNPVDPLPFLQR